MNNVIAIIPARGGSKGVLKKNIKPLAGKPLIAHSIEEAKKSEHISKVFVSTEDDEIAEVSKKYGAEIIRRPEDLAQDNTPTKPVLQHAIQFLEEKGEKVNALILLQATHPVREEGEVDKAVEMLMKTEADSVVTVRKVPKHFHPEWQMGIEDKRVDSVSLKKIESGFQRQALKEKYHRSGSVYAIKRDTLMKKNSIYGDDCRSVVASAKYWINIDEELDYLVAELLLNNKKRDDNQS